MALVEAATLLTASQMSLCDDPCGVRFLKFVRKLFEVLPVHILREYARDDLAYMIAVLDRDLPLVIASILAALFSSFRCVFRHRVQIARCIRL